MWVKISTSMNKTYCVSKKIFFLSSLVLSIIGLTAFFSMQNNAKKMIGSKAKEPSSLRRAPSAVIAGKLASCTSLSGSSRLGCIADKLQQPMSKWNEIGKGRLLYKGEVLRAVRKPGKKNPSNGKTQVMVGPIYASDNISPEHIRKIKNIIQSWNSENISKEIVLIDSVISYDSAQKTNCIEDEYWTSLQVYYPDALCEDVKAGENTPIGYQTVGSGGVISYSEYVPLILVDSLNTDSDEYVIKHEFGHLLGAEDNDFVDIAGNTMFDGNNHSATDDPYNDIMYQWRTDVKDITRIQIQKSPSIHEFFDPFNTANWSSVIDVRLDGKQILGKRYKLYAGKAGTNHFAGAITESPVCEGVTNPTNGSITLCKEFLVEDNSASRHVAGFLHFVLNNVGYVGKFDALELIMSIQNGKPHVVNLNKERVAKVDETDSVATFTNLVPDQKITSLSDIRIRVSDIPYLPFKSWSMCYRAMNAVDCVPFNSLKGEGRIRMNSSDTAVFDIPVAFLNSPGQYEFVLTARYLNQWIASREYVVQKNITLDVDFSPRITGVSFNGTNVTVNGTGLTAQHHKARLLVDGTDVTPEGGYNTFTDTALIAGLTTTYGNKITTVQLYYPDIKTFTNVFTYSVSSDPVGIVALIPNEGKGSESTYMLDANSTATVRFDFTCNDSLKDIIYGMNTADNLLGTAYMKTKPTCNKGERVIDTFRIPYPILNEKNLFGEQAKLKIIRYVCSPQPMDTSVVYSAQTNPNALAIQSVLNNTKAASKPVSQCETEAISFEKRTYN